ncbi:MAG TPA: toll/interleukin-1 receptor domain-containing protein [Candidatus Angelobacter sp.]
MANPEHLAILRQGMHIWNEWRSANPKVQPDLRTAYLSETSLEWSEPNLPSDVGIIADFGGYNFRRANLSYSILKGANFRKATLVEADLSGANLRRADMRDADLRQTRFFHANLTLANLSNTDLTGAMFWETVLARVNFTGASGLEACRHGGPSIIDERTLRRSGALPLEFLRGCGLSDGMIRLLPSLRKRTYFHSCFISYSSRDQDFAEHLNRGLQRRGVRCWFATEHMRIGDPIRDRIDLEIQSNDKLLLILSENSVCSPWVQSEVEAAFEKERSSRKATLFPIRLDDAVMESKQAWAAEIRRARHIGDFSNWRNRDIYKKAFDRLLRDLRADDKAKSD